jgi:hypothetical protein
MRTIAGGAVGCDLSSVGDQPTPAREIPRYVGALTASNTIASPPKFC